jgi:hypothetical protein
LIGNQKSPFRLEPINDDGAVLNEFSEQRQQHPREHSSVGLMLLAGQRRRWSSTGTCRQCTSDYPPSNFLYNR